MKKKEKKTKSFISVLKTISQSAGKGCSIKQDMGGGRAVWKSVKCRRVQKEGGWQKKMLDVEGLEGGD